MKTTITTCEICNKEFEAKRNDARFCSAACKQQHYLQRKSGEEPQQAALNERKKQAQSGLDELLNRLLMLWDKHIKNETNYTELVRKIASYKQAHELLVVYNTKNKDLLQIDIFQHPLYCDLIVKIDEKHIELSNSKQK